jgi:hypothetical protein
MVPYTSRSEPDKNVTGNHFEGVGINVYSQRLKPQIRTILSGS